MPCEGLVPMGFCRARFGVRGDGRQPPRRPRHPHVLALAVSVCASPLRRSLARVSHRVPTESDRMVWCACRGAAKTVVRGRNAGHNLEPCGSVGGSTLWGEGAVERALCAGARSPQSGFTVPQLPPLYARQRSLTFAGVASVARQRSTC
ncbi:hypothetical protein TRVL_07003 [Trypanosoma vivax]|nr:hypothetical protein TRVL_07003 [Trypanosoma vivax]